MKKKYSPIKIIFLISLFYYVLLLGYAFFCMIGGVDSGWAMPAMSDGSKDYGIAAFYSGIAIGILFTVEYCIFIPIFQVIYLIASGVKRLVTKHKK